MIVAGVLIPVLRRPGRVEAVARSVMSSGTGTATSVPVFLVSPGDREELEAVEGYEHVVVPFEQGPGDWARKINHGLRETAFDWVLTGADDLRFHKGWLDKALDVHRTTGACVVGTNDRGNSRVVQGLHATHNLIHRDYLECGTIDADGVVVHEGYAHNFVDDELVGTAGHWGTWAFARDAVVEHLHPDWRKGEMDDVYRLGKSSFEADRALFKRRQLLWGGTR